MTEICICAAIKMHDGYIIRGHRHGDCFRAAEGFERYKNLTPEQKQAIQQGFLTTENRFVGRYVGYDLMRDSGIKRRCYDPEDSGKFFWTDWKDSDEKLYSEDLY